MLTGRRRLAAAWALPVCALLVAAARPASAQATIAVEVSCGTPTSATAVVCSVSWPAVPGTSGYRLTLGSAAASTQTTTSHRSAWTPGEALAVTVEALDSRSRVIASGTITHTAPAWTAPNTPTSWAAPEVIAVTVSDVDHSSATVAVFTSHGIDSDTLTVSWSADPAAPAARSLEVDGETTSVVLGWLQPATTYRVSASFFGTAADDDPSAVFTTSPAPDDGAATTTAPPTPQMVVASPSDAEVARLSLVALISILGVSLAALMTGRVWHGGRGGGS